MSDGEAEENSNISELLAAVDRGEPGALDELVAAVYPELKRLAHLQLAGERPGHTFALGMAVRTVERDWQRAKAYLLKAMDANAR
jgi:hypothetical protein